MPPLPKRKPDSHHPKMQLMEKQIVGQGVDKVGCEAGHNLWQNNALERGDTFICGTSGDLGLTGAVGQLRIPLAFPFSPPLWVLLFVVIESSDCNW